MGAATKFEADPLRKLCGRVLCSKQQTTEKSHHLMLVALFGIARCQFTGLFHPSELTPGNSEQCEDRKSTRLNSSHGYISYAVFCLKTNSQRSRIPSGTNR